MAWAWLLLAGLMEIGFTTAMRYSEGFTRLVPTLLFVVFAGLSFYLLERATRDIPLGTAYAVWTGIGAAGTVMIGAACFGEPLSLVRFLLLAMLVGSIIGLKLVS